VWVSKEDLQKRKKQERADREMALKESKRMKDEQRLQLKARAEEERLREQVLRMEKARMKSKDRHKRVLVRTMEVSEGRGGTFDRQWKTGTGWWCKTGKAPRRGMAWVTNMAEYVRVKEAKMGGIEKDKWRSVVLSGLFKWREDGGTQGVLDGNGLRVDGTQRRGDTEGERAEDVGGRSCVQEVGTEVGSSDMQPTRIVGKEGMPGRRRSSNRRPRIGPTTTTTPTPTTQRACADDATRRRREGFHPKEGIG
jgi:hypothetical protein